MKPLQPAMCWKPLPALVTFLKTDMPAATFDNSTRASRTAIGIKVDGTVVMLMVDGRQAPTPWV